MTPDAPKNERGLTQMIMMGKSIRQIWVKDTEDHCPWPFYIIKMFKIHAHNLIM